MVEHFGRALLARFMVRGHWRLPNPGWEAQRDGVWYAAPSQIAADLLTSPGRGPAEGEELIEWMFAHEGAWRR